MIPIRDSVRSKDFPVINLTLIIINVLIFGYEVLLNEREIIAFIYNYGVVPNNVTTAFLTGNITLATIVPLFTTMFLHGGLVHIGGNMLFLWVFGDNIEDRLGHIPYLFFYIITGLAATTAQILSNPLAQEPLIGASGAVAGVLGAYFIAFPRAKVVTLVPILFFITFIEVPALVFLFLWFLIQTFNGLAAVGAAGNMVAWWAHIGGFVAGMLLIKLMPVDLHNKE